MLPLFGSELLLRYQPLNKRIKYREEKEKIMISKGAKLSQYVIILVEYQREDLKWTNKCVVGEKNWPATKLI